MLTTIIMASYSKKSIINRTSTKRLSNQGLNKLIQRKNLPTLRVPKIPKILIVQVLISQPAIGALGLRHGTTIKSQLLQLRILLPQKLPQLKLLRLKAPKLKVLKLKLEQKKRLVLRQRLPLQKKLQLLSQK